jgi:aspartyl-tRNA(Asn)/glutamyl-tRNA(Gln) amidotransferase subunit C
MLDSTLETTPFSGAFSSLPEPEPDAPTPIEDPIMSQPTLSIADVEHVAALARLGLSEDEKTRLSQQLSSILDHISVLNQLDTDHIPPTAQVIEVANVLRDDDIRPSLPREAILANAPRSVDGFFAVQAVLGGEEESA